MAEPKIPWPHAPVHQLSEGGTFFVTTGTYQKEHFFRGEKRLKVLHRGLLTLAEKFGWRFEAWAVFSNHYHFVAHSPTDARDASSLQVMLKILHTKTAEWVNGLDNAPRREVWHNFWETRLSNQTSYFARLKYVHTNPVHHRLVPVANQYPWCSAAWFERSASPAIVKSIFRFNVDRIAVDDEFDVNTDW